MGFYPAHVIVAEARRHGVEIRGADIHMSDVGATVEEMKEIDKSQISNLESAKTEPHWGRAPRQRSPAPHARTVGAIRLGLETVRGLGAEAGTAIVAARGEHPFRSLADLCLRTGLGRRALEALIMAGALDRWERPRRQLLWELQSALQAAKAAPALGLEPKGEPTFAALPRHERLWLEQTYTGATAGAHITTLVARQLRQMGATPSAELERWPDGTRIRIGGVIVARQRPPTANGIAFLAVEDENGIVNVMLPADVVDTYRRPVMSRFVVVEGKIQRDGAAMTVVGNRVIPLGVG
jgi:error-prone DNA polymerase